MDNMQNDRVNELIEQLQLENEQLRKNQRKPRKKLTKSQRLLIGFLATVVLLVGGTIGSYVSLTVLEVVLRGPARNHYGRLHVNIAQLEDGNINHNIFVENFGLDSIFVRVRLREFLRDERSIIGQSLSQEQIDINDPLTWPVFQADPLDVTERREATASALIGQAGVDWTLGDLRLERKIFMPTHNRVAEAVPAGSWLPSVPILFQNQNTFRMVEATGAAVDTGVGTVLSRDARTIRELNNFGVQTGPGLGFRQGLGTHDEWQLADELVAPLLHINANGQIAIARQRHIMRARPTLTPSHGSIMTIQNWVELDRPRGNFWVYDDYDDWFYWAGRIPAGAATSLLLDSLQLTGIAARFEYAIYAETEFFNEENARSYVFSMSPTARSMVLSEYRIITAPVNRQFLYQGQTIWINPVRMEDRVYGHAPVRIRETTTNFVAELLDEVGNVVGVFDNINEIATAGLHISMTNEYGTQLRTIQNNDSIHSRNTQHFALTIGNAQPEGEYRLRILETVTNTSTYIRITVNEPQLNNNLRLTNNLTWISGSPWEAHSVFQDPDNPYLQWRVLVPDDGAGNALIITEHLQADLTAWSPNEQWVLYEFSTAFNEVSAWWNNPDPNIGPGGFIKNLALTYGYQNELRATVGPTTDHPVGVETIDLTNSAFPWTTVLNQALTRPHGAPGHTLEEEQMPAFILSASEANLYFATNEQRMTTRITNLPPFAPADNRWHLRSEGNGTTGCVTADGYVTIDVSLSTTGCGFANQPHRALRPAVWIRLNH